MIRALKRLLRAIWWLLCSSRRREQITWDMTQEQKAQLRADFRAAYGKRYEKIREELGECLTIGKLLDKSRKS